MAQSQTIVAFDGEGIQDKYILLASSDGPDIHAKQGLKLSDCLEFLTLPERKHTLNVWYSFGYDVNMMLRGLGSIDFWQGRRALVLSQYEIRYFPNKLLKIKHAGKVYTHYDIFGFFQTSFRQAILKWLNVTDEVIEAGKAARGQFERWKMEQIVEYNRRELIYLRQLGEKVVDIFSNLDLSLRMKSWHGAGAAAQAAFKGIELHEELASADPRVEEYAREAYYGGRVETLQRGSFEQVYHYDLKSAYPSAALHLPNLSRSTWQETKRYAYGRLGVYRVSFRSFLTDRLGAFPIRLPSSLIVFPIQGEGTYWSYEIESAKRAGIDVDIQGGLYLEKFYPSRLRKLVASLYALRKVYRAVGDGREKAVKLILNALYGKLAQKEGGRYQSLALAGMITSYTRAKIFSACYPQQDSIISIATDGVYSQSPLSVELGDNLDQWENDQGSLNQIMNGVYRYQPAEGKAEIKTRGFNLDTDEFIAMYAALECGLTWTLRSRRFVTNSLYLSQSHTRRKPCVWEVDRREINPTHDHKRCWPKAFDGQPQTSAPLIGGWKTLYYQPKIEATLEPEYIDLDLI